MAGAGLVEQRVQVVGDLDHRGVHRVGEEEVDHHPAHASVARNQPSRGFHGVQRDRLDFRQLFVAQELGAVDERSDGQVIAERLAVGIVGKRIDATRVRCLPGCLGQLLDGAKGFAGKCAALCGRDRDQRPVRLGVCVLQRLVLGEFRIVLAEENSVIVGNGDETNARGHCGHHDRRQRYRRPRSPQNQIENSVECFRIHCPSAASTLQRRISGCRAPECAVFRWRAVHQSFTTREISKHGYGRASCSSGHPRRTPIFPEAGRNFPDLTSWVFLNFR